jgi:hypothetical protein
VTRPVIRLKAGDDRTVRVAVQNADLSPRDLTGEVVEFRAAPSLGASAATISKTDGNGIVVVDAADGLIDVVFYPDDTATTPSLLLWEIRVTDVAGLITTLDFGAADSPETYGVLRIERAMLLAG